MSDLESANSPSAEVSKDPPYKDASVAPYVVRPLFFLLTVLLVVSAIAQVGGRIVFANLERFEPRINELLAPRGIEVADVSGQWRFFNPVLKIGSGSAPGAHFGASWAEIDTLESLARNRIVLRNAQVSDLQLTLSQDEAGAWSLDGQVPTDTTFDWRSLVWHSDQLELNANLTLRGYELPVSELVLGASLSNFGGRHRGDVRLGAAGNADDAEACNSTQERTEGLTCDLRARYNVEESALWFRPRSGGAVLDAQNFHLQDSAAELVGLVDLTLGTVDVRMRLLDERYSGPIRLLDSSFQLPGGQPTNLSLLAEGWSEDDGSIANFALSALQLGNDESVLEVRDSKLNWTIDQGAVLRIPEVNVEKVTALANHMVSPEIPVALWIKRLNMSGQFTRMLASWSSEAGIGFSGDFNSVAMQNFRGVPKVDDLVGSFTGGPGYLQLRMLDTSAVVGFPQLYREERAYDSVSGEVIMYFGQDYFGLKGSNLQLVAPEMTTAGSFSLVSAKTKSNNHLTLALSSDAGDFGDLSPYIPYTLPQNTLDWLAESGLSAKLEAPRFVMHAPLREEESQMGRSYLVDADMHTGAMVFNAAWPQITNAEGHVKLSHTGIIASLTQATFAGLALEDMNIRIPTGTTNVAATGTAVFDASTGLEFIRTTPLKTSMDFVADDWWASGQMRLAVDLRLPLEDNVTGELDPRVRVNVDGQLQGTTFGMPEAGLTFTDLRGPLTYSYPYELAGNDIEGKLFDRDMTLDLTSDAVGSAPTGPLGRDDRFAPRRIDFSMLGVMHSNDMWPLLNMEPSEVVDGQFDFAAVYSTETGTDAKPTLFARTDFVGAKVALPAPLGKDTEQVADSRFNIVFDDDVTRAKLRYRGLLDADLGVGEGEIVGGHLHLFSEDEADSVAPSITRTLASWNGEPGPVLIDGNVSFADVTEWSAGSEQGVDLPPYRISALKIAQAAVGDFEVPSVEVSGESNNELLRLAFDSEAAKGELRVPEVGITELVLERFAYVGDDEPQHPAFSPDMGEDEIRASLFAEKGETAAAPPVIDPLSPEILAELSDMNVRLENLSIDGEDFGNWIFNIRTTPEGVSFSSLSADLRGIEIKSVEGAIWDRASNRTSIRTTLMTEDMGDVLEASGYARSLESESMLTRASVSWPGSPLNFELLQLQGDVQMGVKEGRFLDATSGNNALRIFSLLNFTAIAKRMSLNFKDVFGRGISFEKIEADTKIDEGVLSFVQPMRVEGTGGDFKVNGVVDLNEGTLDNEMVVTLPVNKSLPWLGAYLALANPVVGLGVLVGERILRKPIKELSSAKYKISGPADDPELELVSVFDRSMDEGSGNGEGTEIIVPDDLPPLEELMEESPLATDTLVPDTETKAEPTFDGSIEPPAARLPAIDSSLPGILEPEIYRPEFT